MAQVQVTLNVASEFQTIVDGLVKVYGDLKAQKGTAVELSDAMPILMAGLTSYQMLGADVKSADNVAYLFRAIAQVVFPAGV